MILFKIKSLAKRLIVSLLTVGLIVQQPINVPKAEAKNVSVITGLSAIPEHNFLNLSSDSTNREELNFNTGWLFKREDVSGAQEANFDDSGWEESIYLIVCVWSRRSAAALIKAIKALQRIEDILRSTILTAVRSYL